MGGSASLKISMAAACAILAAAGPASAQNLAQGAAPPAKPEMTESCPGLVASRSPRGVPAAFRLAALNADQVRISYIGHSTFLVESPQLVRIATDYNDYIRSPVRARHRDHEPRTHHPLHRPS